MHIDLKRDPSDADIAAVRDGLRAANRLSAPADAAAPQTLVLHLLADDGAIAGGLVGILVLDWLVIDMLHVDAALRRRGHGAALMARAEAFARERDAVGIWLDTFSFQARPFYDKLGYTVFGTLEDHPRGAQRFFMQKRLAPT